MNPPPGHVQIRANLQADYYRNCYTTGCFLRAIRRGVFLERDGRPETGRVAWCWRPRSPLESLNGVLSVWAHINELAHDSASPSRRSKATATRTTTPLPQ